MSTQAFTDKTTSKKTKDDKTITPVKHDQDCSVEKLRNTDVRFVFDAKESLHNASDIGSSESGHKPVPPHFFNRFMHAPIERIENAFGKIDPHDWDDWRWQQRKRFRLIEQLEGVINISDNERSAFEKSNAMFHMGITPYYASLMDKDDPNCPIRLQSVPQLGELDILDSDLEDPLGEEQDMPVPGITHRYPDRVLFYTTHNCPVYCRHCTRKRKVSDPSTMAAKEQIETAIEYIAKTKTVRDIVISGGDPLSLSDERLDYILTRLRQIPHVEIFRMGTKPRYPAPASH